MIECGLLNRPDKHEQVNLDFHLYVIYFNSDIQEENVIKTSNYKF